MTKERQAALEFIKPKLPSIRERVYDNICKFPKGITAKELSILLQVKPQTITGRLDELQDEGVVFASSRVDSETRYKKSLPQDVHIHAKARKVEKFTTWMKKGMTRYGDFIDRDVWEKIHKDALKKFNLKEIIK